MQIDLKGCIVTWYGDPQRVFQVKAGQFVDVCSRKDDLQRTIDLVSDAQIYETLEQIAGEKEPNDRFLYKPHDPTKVTV